MGNWLKKEILHILPVFFFFLIAFNVINLTEHLMFQGIGYRPFSFWEIFLAAALVAKILLVLDHLPIIDIFPCRPLIFQVLWKTILYWIITLIVRLAIRLAPFIIDGGSLAQGWKAFDEQMNWGMFIGIGSYYLMLLFLYVTARELTFALGPHEMRKLFFGR
jgi:hypothetical protein